MGGLDPAEGLVAFTATGEGSRSLQVIDVDGDDPVVIDGGLSHQSSPSWSPDGSQVVYAVDSGTDQVLWVAPAGGGGVPVQLTSREGEGFSQDQRPVWSPDGGRVAFISNRGSEIGSIVSIYVMAAAGGTPERIGPDPIDSQVCAELGGEMRCDVRPTGDARRVTWLPGSGDLVYRHVAFVDNRSEDDVLYVMNADGTGQTDVVDGEGDIEDLHWLSPPG